MADHMTPEQRSRAMSRVGGKDTAPELYVRRALHAVGLRFRLHRRDLPGKPDMVLPRHRTVVLVHGCFWHGHDCPRGARPQSNQEFWAAKLDRNIDRDHSTRIRLEALGWHVETVWECALDLGVERIVRRLQPSADTRASER
ncbi:DNA mismatch endonuclease Vsr [Sphingomonas sp. CL5.1]|nr:DNA mismatch endonuclease Vsr [Sphingobium sp. CAP-1]QKR98442.1 DNA mismatch endonuclease Vsr [Sphingomonas sp. CL5.1]